MAKSSSKKVSATPKIEKKNEERKSVKKQRGVVRRAQKKKEPRLVENPKSTMFIRGSTANKRVLDVMRDFIRLKNPLCKVLSKKNEIRPFENVDSLEFLAQKNDCSLFVVGSNSKKRPDNLILGRLFNHQLMDMLELGIQNYQSMEECPGRKSSVGSKPLILFQGDQFQYSESHMLLKSLLLDMFAVTHSESVNASGVNSALVVTSLTHDTTPSKDGDQNPLVLIKLYSLNLSKSASKSPRVELELMGPSMTVELKRMHENTGDLKKQSLRVPKELKPAKVKNIKYNELGDKVGRIHMTKQPVDDMQVRKIKALKNIRKEGKLKKRQEKKEKEAKKTEKK